MGFSKNPLFEPLKSKMAEIRHLGPCRSNAKTRFSQKLSDLELWSLLTIGSRTWAFQRIQYWTHKIQDGENPPS